MGRRVYRRVSLPSAAGPRTLAPRRPIMTTTMRRLILSLGLLLPLAVSAAPAPPDTSPEAMLAPDSRASGPPGHAGTYAVDGLSLPVWRSDDGAVVALQHVFGFVEVLRGRTVSELEDGVLK